MKCVDLRNTHHPINPNTDGLSEIRPRPVHIFLLILGLYSNRGEISEIPHKVMFCQYDYVTNNNPLRKFNRRLTTPLPRYIILNGLCLITATLPANTFLMLMFGW